MAIKNSFALLDKLDFYLKNGEQIIKFEEKNRISSDLNREYLPQLKILYVYETILKHEPFMKYFKSKNIHKIINVLNNVSENTNDYGLSFESIKDKIDIPKVEYKKYIESFKEMTTRYAMQDEDQDLFKESGRQLEEASLKDFLKTFSREIDIAKNHSLFSEDKDFLESLKSAQKLVESVRTNLQHLDTIKEHTLNEYLSLNDDINDKYKGMLMKAKNQSLGYKSTKRNPVMEEAALQVNDLLKKLETNTANEEIKKDIYQQIQETVNVMEEYTNRILIGKSDGHTDYLNRINMMREKLDNRALSPELKTINKV